MRTEIHIPLSRVYIDESIKRKVSQILESGHYILNKECSLFEEEFAKFIGTKYAVSVSTGTAAIWLSLISLRVKPNDEIIVPSLTAFPTVEPILYLKAKPVFVDIDQTYTINPLAIEQKITKKTVGIIPVHLYGHPANMRQILDLAHKYKLFVLEDCCQAHGARFQNKPVGSIGDAGCFSFYPSKNLTVCGDGGMIATNSKSINKMVRVLRDHGRSSKYIHNVIGYNMRFNEIQAAIGRIELAKLNKFNKRRRKIANIYFKMLNGLPIIFPQEEEWGYHVYHMFVIRIKGRNAFKKSLFKRGIGTGIHYPIPCHLQPPILKTWGRMKLPVTEKYCKEILSLPMFPMLKDSQVSYISRVIREELNKT